MGLAPWEVEKACGRRPELGAGAPGQRHPHFCQRPGLITLGQDDLTGPPYTAFVLLPNRPTSPAVPATVGVPSLQPQWGFPLCTRNGQLSGDGSILTAHPCTGEVTPRGAVSHFCSVDYSGGSNATVNLERASESPGGIAESHQAYLIH